MTTPDFEALRAKRNAAHEEWMAKFAAEHGIDHSQCRTSFNSAACYCACTTGGPCEHTWDGVPYEGDGMWSTTCGRCGTASFSHDMRVLP